MPYDLEYKLLPEKYIKKRIIDSILDEFSTLIQRSGYSLTDFKEQFGK